MKESWKNHNIYQEHYMRQSNQERTKQNLWKTAFKKFEVISKAIFHKFHFVHS